MCKKKGEKHRDHSGFAGALLRALSCRRFLGLCVRMPAVVGRDACCVATRLGSLGSEEPIEQQAQFEISQDALATPTSWSKIVVVLSQALLVAREAVLAADSIG